MNTLCRASLGLMLLLLAGCGCSRTTSSPASNDAAAPRSQPEPPRVEVGLRSASASWSGETLRLDAEVVVQNRTGAPLNVISTCSSAYDGLAAVLRDPSGRELHRQLYIAHQSPFSEGRVYPLRPGETVQRLSYPLFDAGLISGPVDVTIEGGLDGTDWNSGLVSEPVRITVPPRP